MKNIKNTIIMKDVIVNLYICVKIKKSIWEKINFNIKKNSL